MLKNAVFLVCEPYQPTIGGSVPPQFTVSDVTGFQELTVPPSVHSIPLRIPTVLESTMCIALTAKSFMLRFAPLSHLQRQLHVDRHVGLLIAGWCPQEKYILLVWFACAAGNPPLTSTLADTPASLVLVGIAPAGGRCRKSCGAFNDNTMVGEPGTKSSRRKGVRVCFLLLLRFSEFGFKPYRTGHCVCILNDSTDEWRVACFSGIEI